MSDVIMEEEQERDISDLEPQKCPSALLERKVMQVVNHTHRVHVPVDIVLATVLYYAEFVTAAVLGSMYHRTDDGIWMGFTIAFMLVPAVLIQMALIFVHRDRDRDRPLVLFLHLLLLGPVIRCIEALIVYFRMEKGAELYATICRKIYLDKEGQGTPMEWHVGRSERRLVAHRNAIHHTVVIQAFVGSTPQLTLQLYATFQGKYFLPLRGTLMVITLISVIYGALVCSVLAIQIRYIHYKVHFRPVAYMCMIAWRGLEIATRVTALVLFSMALTHWVILVGMVNLLFFFFLPWAEFWAKKGSLTQDVEKNFSNPVLSMFTLLYAFINICCWSDLQLDFTHRELIDRKQRWSRLAMYYSGRFVENLVLILLWYFFKSDCYGYMCTPLLGVQVVIFYSLSVIFMLLFYQFCHPCRRLFKYNVHDCLHCVCCRKGTTQQPANSNSPTATIVLPPDEPDGLLDPDARPDLSELQPGERETAIVDDMMEAA